MEEPLRRRLDSHDFCGLRVLQVHADVMHGRDVCVF